MKLLLATILFLLAGALWADTCPTVDAIKSNRVIGWKVYDSDDGVLLSKKRLTAFKKNIHEFAMAEWPKNPHSQGTIHCFYRDKNGSDLEAYLTQGHFILGENKKYWYEVSGHMQCAAKQTDCEFQKSLASEAQLAKN